MLPHTQRMRLAAAIVYAASTLLKLGPISKLWARMALALDIHVRAHSAYRMVPCWGKALLARGTVHNKHRAPKKERMPPEEARLAAMLLKTGTWVDAADDGSGRPRRVHIYFTSVAHACECVTQLRAIRDKHGLSNEELLELMKKADPGLRRRRLQLKHGFSPEECSQRRKRATSLLARFAREPDWAIRTYFIDESTIILARKQGRGLHVWCDTHDTAFHDTASESLPSGYQAIRVHFIAAVNAVFGPVYLEFTTGTTDIQRFHNKIPLEQHGPYKVRACSHSLQADDCVVFCIHHRHTSWQRV